MRQNDPDDSDVVGSEQVCLIGQRIVPQATQAMGHMGIMINWGKSHFCHH